MAVNAPEEEKIIPLAEGYGDDPYNDEAVANAIAVIREACASKGHRCLLLVDPEDGPFFAGYIGSLEWVHFMAGRLMRHVMDERQIYIELCDMDDIEGSYE